MCRVLCQLVVHSSVVVGTITLCMCIGFLPLQILQQLANLQPAVDEFGSVLQPLPRAHRGLADPSCLPHIAQVILTGKDRYARLCCTSAHRTICAELGVSLHVFVEVAKLVAHTV